MYNVGAGDFHRQYEAYWVPFHASVQYLDHLFRLLSLSLIKNYFDNNLVDLFQFLLLSKVVLLFICFGEVRCLDLRQFISYFCFHCLENNGFLCISSIQISSTFILWFLPWKY